MPLDAISHREASRRYIQKTDKFSPPTKTQTQLNSLAASVGQKGPTHCNALSMLYLSALILPNILQIRSSPANEHLSSDANDTRHRSNVNGHNVSLPAALMTVSHRTPSTTISVQHRGEASPNRMLVAPFPSPTSSTQPAKARSTDWLRFPMADAALPSLDYLQRDEENNMLIAHGDAGKSMLLSLAKSFLSNIEKATQQQIQDFEFEWLQAAATGPISIARVDINATLSRKKRISFTERNQQIMDHIQEHCAHEMQIYNSEGLSEGKMLILKAQRTENPFRMLYDDIDGFDPPKLLEYASEGVNFLVNILTLGLKPMITGPFANNFRRRYYEGLDDEICARRQNHITFAQVATSLDVSGMKFISAKRAVSNIPMELQNTRSLQEFTTYVAHDKKNIRTSLSLLVRNKKPPKSQSELALKAKEGNEFETYYPDPADPTGQKKRVVFDEKQNIWRYDDASDKSPLDVRLKQGETFISLHGKHFPIRYVDNGQYEIITQTRQGVKHNLPVYCEPLSNTWHLETVNGHPVFTPSQKEIIKQIQIETHENFKYNEINNLHTRLYGDGKLYEVRNLQDDISTTPPLYTVIEMNGALVPVKSLVNKQFGTHYYAYDVNVHSHIELSIEWTGKRWILAKSTSPHVSQDLIQRVTPDMYAKEVNEELLSAPDQQGIKWANGQGYLNIRSQYVEIHKGVINQVGPANGNRIIVYYANQQFRPLVPGDQMLLWRRQVAEHFYEMLKDTSKQHLQEGYSFIGLKKAAKIAFVSGPMPTLTPPLPKQPVSVNVEAVPSSEIGRKRYLVTLGENDYFFVEISHDGKQVWVLKDEESERAMDKHQRNLAGGAIPTAIALKRNIDPEPFRARSRAEIDKLAFERIESGARLFENVLKEMRYKGEADVQLVVGHADFLMTSAFENNVFSSTINIYQALIDTFIPLSKAYPNAIIIPGSVYVSQDIPPQMQQLSLRYRQGDRDRYVANSVNFATIMAPVLYKGKFITIARKGEYLTYTRQYEEPGANPIVMTSLSDDLPYASTITVRNAKPVPYAISSEWNEAHSGTIYAGKTLLPTEKVQAEWFFCPCRDKNGALIEVDRFFSNEFIIGDEKFLLVIEDEFIQQGNTKPTVRSLPFPQNETVDDSNRYDWIIHLGTTELDDTMRSASYNYLQSDRNSNSHFSSNVSQRLLTKTYVKKQKLVIYEFTSD